MYCNVPLQSLPIGAKLGSSIYDDRQTKLLASGMQITGQLLETLHRRNVESVVVSQQDLGRILAFQPQGKSRHAPADRRPVRAVFANDATRVLDQHLATCDLPKLAPSSNPFARKLQPTGLEPYDPDLMNYLAEKREDNVQRLHTVVEACGRRSVDEIATVADVAAQSIQAAVEDVDAYACLSANPYMLPYPSRHVLHTAMVATSIGVKLGLDERSLHELSVGCMIHDLGMLCIDRMTVGAKKILEPIEFAEIAKHPVHTFDLIEKHLDDVPVGARMVAYQMHERCNGSGYPRGRTRDQMHPLARIAAVADTYTALVSARPHRPGLLPYYAMEKLVRDVARGLFDSQAVRGLLHAVSLFPVGSFVELSEGHTARVIRTFDGNYARPVVELWKRDRLGGKPAVVDLAQESGLKVVRPLANLQG
jgi:HD-GYP domain-containing protein (c-di-GMP phosphodiesterase class II)